MMTVLKKLALTASVAGSILAAAAGGFGVAHADDTRTETTSVALGNAGQFQLCVKSGVHRVVKCQVTKSALKDVKLNVAVSYPVGHAPTVTPTTPCPDGQVGVALEIGSTTSGVLGASISGKDPLTGKQLTPVAIEETIDPTGALAYGCLYEL